MSDIFYFESSKYFNIRHVPLLLQGYNEVKTQSKTSYGIGLHIMPIDQLTTLSLNKLQMQWFWFYYTFANYLNNKAIKSILIKYKFKCIGLVNCEINDFENNDYLAPPVGPIDIQLSISVRYLDLYKNCTKN